MEAPILTKEQLEAMEKYTERVDATNQIIDYLSDIGVYGAYKYLTAKEADHIHYQPFLIYAKEVKQMLAEAYLAGVAAGKESSVIEKDK